MIYAVSDLHGCYEKYIKLLERLNLTEKDSLFILGDIVDRGDGGMKILLDLATRKNIFAYRGNHDHCALMFLRNFVIPNDGYLADGLIEAFRAWLADGGNTTYEGFTNLSKEKQRIALSYLNSLPLFKELSV